MSTEELLDRSQLRTLWREQERERRRMRDRQRRQSMSLEDRERHLARRRRNYQLRRRRAGNAQADSVPNQATPMASLANRTMSSQGQPVVNISDVSALQDSVVHDKGGQGKEKIDPSGGKSDRHKLVLPTNLRLSHIKHLARSLSGPTRELIATHLFDKNNASGKGSLKPLRLSHVECLARVLQPCMKDTAREKQKVDKEIVENTDCSRSAFSISGESAKFWQIKLILWKQSHYRDILVLHWMKTRIIYLLQL